MTFTSLSAKLLATLDQAIWCSKPFCRSWKFDALAILEEEWFQHVWDVRVHQGIVPEVIDMLLETLLTLAPLNFAHLPTTDIPAPKAREGLAGVYGVHVRNEIHEGVAETHAACKVYR